MLRVQLCVHHDSHERSTFQQEAQQHLALQLSAETSSTHCSVGTSCKAQQLACTIAPVLLSLCIRIAVIPDWSRRLAVPVTTSAGQMLESVEVPIAMSDSAQLNATMCLLCISNVEMLPSSPWQARFPCKSSCHVHPVQRMQFCTKQVLAAEDVQLYNCTLVAKDHTDLVMHQLFTAWDAGRCCWCA